VRTYQPVGDLGSRATCLVEEGMESIVSVVEDMSDSTLRWKDL